MISNRRLETRWDEGQWLLYALPCVIIWSFYLLAFFPGSMSPDSLSQWRQMLEFRFTDIHPAFHTLTNWLITRLWLSPAAIAITQIVVLALVFALVMREMASWGVPTWMRVLITAIFALSPVNGFISITLWKDVAFSIAVLALWWLLLRIAWQHASVFASPRFMILATIVLIAVSLYRHNGLPLVLGVLVMLVWLYQDYRKQIILIGALWGIGFLLVKIGLYGMLQVEPTPLTFTYMLPIHQVVALRENTPLMLQETQFLDEMAQPEIWTFYRCYIPSQAIYQTNGPLDANFFSQHVGDFVRIWLTLALRNPLALIEHQLCLSSIIWRIMPLPGSYLYTAQLGIDHNDLGLATQSLLPQLQSILSNVFAWSMTPEINWWFWRPALHQFLLMAILLLAPLERRQRLLLLSSPLFQWLVLLALTAGQDTRYQYPVYVIMLVAPALLFARKPFAPSNR